MVELDLSKMEMNGSEIKSANLVKKTWHSPVAEFYSSLQNDCIGPVSRLEIRTIDFKWPLSPAMDLRCSHQEGLSRGRSRLF